MAKGKISKKEWLYFVAVVFLYVLAILYVAYHNLSWTALFNLSS